MQNFFAKNSNDKFTTFYFVVYYYIYLYIFRKTVFQIIYKLFIIFMPLFFFNNKCHKCHNKS